MHDPDGQKGLGVDHWIHYGIKPTTHQIAAGVGAKSALEGVGGTNSKGNTHYMGPCPPVGDSAHHYIIQIYALDLAPDALPAGLTRAELMEKIKGMCSACWQRGAALSPLRFGRSRAADCSDSPAILALPRENAHYQAIANALEDTVAAKIDRIAQLLNCPEKGEQMRRAVTETRKVFC